MSCERAVIVKTQARSSFGMSETLGGIVLGTLLLGAGMGNFTLGGPKWGFGACNCQPRPTLAGAIPFPAAPSVEAGQPVSAINLGHELPSPLAPMTLSEPGLRAELAAPAALPARPALLAALPAAYAERAESPLPVASPELAGAQVGAEPTLGLSAFPSADPYQYGQEAAAPAAAAPAQAQIPAPRRAFADAPGLDSSDDALAPAPGH